jgi:hypothetical protein
MSVHNDIAACTVITNTHLNRKSRVILKACGSKQWKCTWMAGIYGGLPVI